MAEVLLEFQVVGIDIFDEEISKQLLRNFPDFFWGEFDGLILFSIITKASPIQVAKSFAQKLIKLNLGVTSIKWHEDLVSYAEISNQSGYSPESIRLWFKGERGQVTFVSPRGFVGSGQNRSPVWAWSEVDNWLRENGKLKNLPTERYPTPLEVAQISILLLELAGKQKLRSIS
jgi:hypothetical protein